MKKLALLFCVLFVLSVQSCLDPKAVTDFSSAALETIDLLDEFGRDMKVSCERRAMAQPRLKPDCGKFDPNYASVLAIQGVLKAYVINLQRLADKDKVTYSEDIDSLKEQVNDLESFDEKKVTALGNLGSFLLEAAASGYRRKTLTQIIPDTDSAFAQVMSGLNTFVTLQYERQLTLEKDILEDRRKTIEQEYKELEPLATDIAMIDLDLQLANVKKKVTSIEKFSNALQALKKAHHELAINAKDIDADAVITTLKSYAKEIKKLNTEIRDAF